MPTSTRRSGSGTDIAFLGGIIRYILENDLWFREFALNYTNLAHIIDPEYQDPEQNDGLFSGFNHDTQSYKQDSWQYEGKTVPSATSEHRVQSKDKSRGRRLREHDRSPRPRRTRRSSTRTASTRS